MKLAAQLTTLTIVICLLLTGCNQRAEPQLRVGTNIWPGYEPLYLAEHLHYYDNSPIKLVEMPSSSDVIQSLRNNTLEVAALTLDEALLLTETEFKLKIILAIDYSNGSDVLLVKPTIQSLDELKGKHIAVETTAVGAIMLDGVLSAAQLSLADVTINECTYVHHLDCYQSADGIITFEPVKTKILKLGAKQLFDSSQIPERIIDVLVVREDVITTNPNSLKQLIAGYFNAIQYLNTEPEQASDSISNRMGITPTEVLASYSSLKLLDHNDNQLLLSGKPSRLNLIARDLAEFLASRKLLKEPVTVDTLTTPQFLP